MASLPPDVDTIPTAELPSVALTPSDAALTVSRPPTSSYGTRRTTRARRPGAVCTLGPGTSVAMSGSVLRLRVLTDEGWISISGRLLMVQASDGSSLVITYPATGRSPRARPISPVSPDEAETTPPTSSPE